MLAVDIGDDCGDRRQLDEAAVGLDDRPLAITDSCVDAIGVDDAAVYDRRIKFRAIENGRDDRGRGGLAVRTGHGNRPLVPHQLGQHLGTSNHRDVALTGGHDLGIVFADGRRNDQHRQFVDGLGAMASGDRDSHRAQTFHRRALGDVAALDVVAEVVHHLGDAAHTDTADTGEMDRADGEGQRLHAAPPAFPATSDSGWRAPIRPSTRSASAGAESGRAKRLAATACSDN